MTTHEGRIDVNDLDSDPSFAPAETRLVPDQQSPTDDAQRTTPTPDETELSSQNTLFADDELAGLRGRWDAVQAGFVDNPRECVAKADGLVSDLIETLAEGFAETRSRLEEKWTRGENASTEDLRVALRNYREFFQRLLAV